MKRPREPDDALEGQAGAADHVTPSQRPSVTKLIQEQQHQAQRSQAQQCHPSQQRRCLPQVAGQLGDKGWTGGPCQTQDTIADNSAQMDVSNSSRAAPQEPESNAERIGTTPPPSGSGSGNNGSSENTDRPSHSSHKRVSSQSHSPPVALSSGTTQNTNHSDLQAGSGSMTLPPELKAKLRKKIRIIQPISSTWEADTLQANTPPDNPDQGAPSASPANGVETIHRPKQEQGTTPGHRPPQGSPRDHQTQQHPQRSSPPRSSDGTSSKQGGLGGCTGAVTGDCSGPASSPTAAAAVKMEASVAVPSQAAKRRVGTSGGPDGHTQGGGKVHARARGKGGNSDAQQPPVSKPAADLRGDSGSKRRSRGPTSTSAAGQLPPLPLPPSLSGFPGPACYPQASQQPTGGSSSWTITHGPDGHPMGRLPSESLGLAWLLPLPGQQLVSPSNLQPRGPALPGRRLGRAPSGAALDTTASMSSMHDTMLAAPASVGQVRSHAHNHAHNQVEQVITRGAGSGPGMTLHAPPMGGGGPGSSTGVTVLGEVQDQLSLLYQWYVGNRNAYLDQTKSYLAGLDHLLEQQQQRASHSASASATAVHQAIQAAMQIVKASAEVEGSWRAAVNETQQPS